MGVCRERLYSECDFGGEGETRVRKAQACGIIKKAQSSELTSSF